MKATQPLYFLLLLICALNTTHNAVYNQCILFINQNLLGSDYQLKLTLSVYFCAIFFVRCLIGFVADNCSGKKCMLITLGVALFGHTLACCSNNMSMFIIARFIQGLGLGGGQVMGLILLIQIFSSKGRASIIAAEQVLFSLASVFLPLMGSIFSNFLSWRLTYMAYFSITAFAIFYFCIFQHREVNVPLPEADLTNDVQMSSRRLIFNFRFLTPTFMACFSISAYILWGGYFSLLIRHYQIPLKYLLMYQLLPIVPYFLCSVLFKKLVVHLSKKELYKRILGIHSLAFVSILGLIAYDKTSFSFKFALLLPILLHNVAGAFFRPLMQEKALNTVPNNKIGMASSFISICQVGVNAFFSIIINCMSDFLPAFLGVQLFINLAILIYLLGCFHKMFSVKTLYTAGRE